MTTAQRQGLIWGVLLIPIGLGFCAYAELKAQPHAQQLGIGLMACGIFLIIARKQIR